MTHLLDHEPARRAAGPLCRRARRAGLSARPLLRWTLLSLCLTAALSPGMTWADAPGDALAVPDSVRTHPDGRLPIGDLYQTYGTLLARGWQLDVVVRSQPGGRAVALPVVALRTPQAGAAVWVIAGMHGEEPAGPNAIAAAIDAIATLGAHRPVVLLPLTNPQGYVHNWRYLNTAEYSATVDGHSVGDSSHLLPDPDHPGQARAPAASSPEADAISRYLVMLAAQYPPAVSIDLHEDNLISEGYVYSQGTLGAADPLALTAVRVLQDQRIPLKMSGETRFGEPISGGIIGPVTDSSLDELISAGTIIVDGQPRPGPGAATVLVFETPAGEMPLQRRIDAHAALLRELAATLARPADTAALPGD